MKKTSGTKKKAKPTKAKKEVESPKVGYALDEHGRITREVAGMPPQLLGHLVDGTLTYESEEVMAAYHPRVNQLLDDENVAVTHVTFNQAAEPERPPTPPQPPKPIKDRQTSIGANAAAVSISNDPFQVLPGEDFPPPPPKTKRDGDKTPERVEWLRQYRPAEWRRRYGIQGEGTVTRFRKVPRNDGTARVDLQPYQKSALISARKTHLTEKPTATE